MRLLHAIRRCEELTYENARLAKENQALKQQVFDLEKQLQKKHKKIGDLITDNGRLIKTNEVLARIVKVQPYKRRYDTNGEPIRHEITPKNDKKNEI